MHSGKKSDQSTKVPPKGTPSKIFGISIGGGDSKRFKSTTNLDKQLNLADFNKESENDIKGLMKMFKMLDGKRQKEILKALQPHLNNTSNMSINCEVSGGPEKKKDAKKMVKLKRYADFLGDNK